MITYQVDATLLSGETKSFHTSESYEKASEDFRDRRRGSFMELRLSKVDDGYATLLKRVNKEPVLARGKWTGGI